MASRRKAYSRTKQEHARLPATAEFAYACFMADLLDGTVTATAVHEVRDGNGRFQRLEYDDPNGDAVASGRGS